LEKAGPNTEERKLQERACSGHTNTTQKKAGVHGLVKPTLQSKGLAWLNNRKAKPPRTTCILGEAPKKAPPRDLDNARA